MVAVPTYQEWLEIEALRKERLAVSMWTSYKYADTQTRHEEEQCKAYDKDAKEARALADAVKMPEAAEALAMLEAAKLEAEKTPEQVERDLKIKMIQQAQKEGLNLDVQWQADFFRQICQLAIDKLVTP